MPTTARDKPLGGTIDHAADDCDHLLVLAITPCRYCRYPLSYGEYVAVPKVDQRGQFDRVTLRYYHDGCHKVMAEEIRSKRAAKRAARLAAKRAEDAGLDHLCGGL